MLYLVDPCNGGSQIAWCKGGSGVSYCGVYRTEKRLLFWPKVVSSSRLSFSGQKDIDRT